MIKTQLIPLLPILALLLVFWMGKFPKITNRFSNKISILFSILFLVASVSLKSLKLPIILTLLPISKGLDFAWSLGANHFLFLMLIGCFWLALEIYAEQYFLKNNDKKINQFRILFLTIITSLTFLTLSQNLLSALLCYQLLIVVLCFFVGQFIPKISQKSAKNFGLFILSSTVFLPIAAALTYKVTGNLNFTENGVITSQINLWQYSLLFCFYAISLALIAFMPIYLLFGNLYYLSPPAIIAILPSFAFGILLLLFKVIFYIFGQKLFISFTPNIDYNHLLTIILTLNLLASGLLAIFSKNLKQILTFLFFNQLIFVIIEFFNFGLNAKQMQISITSFILSQVLIFLAIGNISLYLKDSADKTLNGIFYKLRITILVFIFALLNLSGLSPSIGALEKYWLLKTIVNAKSIANAVIMLLNLLLYLVCIAKVIYPMIEILAKNNSKNPSVAKENDIEIAKEIELDLSLILPMVILSSALFILAFASIINF